MSRRCCTFIGAIDQMNVLILRKQRGQQLKELRLSKKVTILALSKETGMHRSTISNIEKGGNSWSVDSELIYLEGLKRL